MRKRAAISCACLAFSLVLSLMLSGCAKQAEEPPKAQLVKAQRVDFRQGGEENVYAGAVCGRYETSMAFQVGGQILRRNVQAGDFVHQGDVLMSINPRDVAQQANQGDAQVESARAQLYLAEANLARYRELYAEDAVPAATLDQYQTSYDAAYAAYQNALAQSVQGHNALSYTDLIANADGVISSVSAEAGQVVAAGQTVLTLVQVDELEVEIYAPENHIRDMALGKAVAVRFWALGNARADGIIREVAPMADAVARTYRVRISISAPPDGMGLGMTASVAVPSAAQGDGEGTATLPLTAIYQTGDTPQVWLVGEDMALSLRPVIVEGFGQNEVRVKGLSRGDVVVTAGVHKLREGQQVRLGDLP